MDGSATLQVRADLEALRARVDGRLAELLPDAARTPARLYAAMSDAVLSGGKRVRPLLTLLTATRLGATEAAVMDSACAVELVHAASLILDDLPCMDDAPTRRGRPAIHVKYGQDGAVLAAVALLNQAFSVLAHDKGVGADTRVEMICALSHAVGAAGLAAGQDQDLQAAPSASPQWIREVNHRKTGSLFVAAVELGGLAAGAGPREQDALDRFAAELGLAFQAMDDLMDGEGLQDADRTTTLSVLGAEGVRNEAALRLQAAKTALRSGGEALARLQPFVDGLLAED